MDLHQLRTFVAVAREGSITRAAEVVHLSQPAVSAHVKELEDALGLSLFERTSRGMVLTGDGQRLLGKAERTLAAHQDLLDEAARGRADLSGKLRLGSASNSHHAALGYLLTALAERHPRLEVSLRHGTSAEAVAGLRNGSLDAALYNEPAAPATDLEAVEISRFKTYLVAPAGRFDPAQPPGWAALAEVPWIYPTASACCGRSAESFFRAHGFRPARIISVDRQALARTLIGSGLGVGLLHADTAEEAERSGEVQRLAEAAEEVRVLFASLASRAKDPVVAAAAAIIRSARPPPAGRAPGPASPGG